MKLEDYWGGQQEEYYIGKDVGHSCSHVQDPSVQAVSCLDLEVKRSADWVAVEQHKECYDGCVENNNKDAGPGGDSVPFLL